MRILVGSSSALDRGAGIAAAARGLCTGLARTGHEVIVACPSFADAEWPKAHGFGHVLTDPNEPQDRAARRLLACIGASAIEGVVNNDNSALQSIAPLVRTPFVSIMHLPTHAIGALAGYNAASIDYLVAISPDMQVAAMERFRLPIHRVPLVYNGMAPPAEVSGRAWDRPVQAVFAGGGNARKGADLMQQFVRTANLGAAELTLDWYGDAPAAIARELATYSGLRFHGRVPNGEFMQRLSRAHVLLLPSRVEGCPMALLEGMARGVVPIVSDGFGAMKWIVQSGYNGFVCSLREWPNQLRDVLQHCATHPSILASLSRQANATFFARFTDVHVATFIHQLLCAPTIDRSRSQAQARVLKWTRPAPTDGSHPGLWERVCYRTGLLRTAARLSV